MLDIAWGRRGRPPQKRNTAEHSANADATAPWQQLTEQAHPCPYSQALAEERRPRPRDWRSRPRE
eukprot:3668649-Pyramimonas_sp.AAC.1